MRPKGRRAGRAIALAAFLAACVDGPTTPGTFGELRIRPTYDADDRPGELGVEVDSAAVRVVRRADAAVPVIDSIVAYDSDTSSFGWILDLRAAAESLDVAVSLWGGGARLYAGEAVIEVRDGAVAPPVLAPVGVTYVGPPIIATVNVTPPTDSLDAFGSTVALSAEARDRHGAVVPGAAFHWTSSHEDVATVDPVSGVVTARGNGSTLVTAVSGAGTGTATLVVSQRVTDVTVTPGAITLTALGAAQTLAVQARDANGHAVAGALVVWSSSAPDIATVDPGTGLVTAVGGGSATITATSGDASASSLVTVNPIADVASIVVSPPAVTLTAVGATRQFSAVARDAAGTVLDGVQFTWASSVSGVAAVDAATGLATAAGHGTSQITASAGAITGSATLSVDLSTTIASVVVTPATAALAAVGATQAFTAVALDAGGIPVPVAGFTWTSSAPDVATVTPTSGVATAVGHGATTIRASVAGVSGEASLSVDLAPTIASIQVTPATATLTTRGATQAFIAVARDATGGVLPGVPFVWTSTVPGVAAVDQTGLATAAGHGATTITATAGGRQGTAILTVNLTATVASIVVTPPSATLTAVGATLQFEAAALDAGGAVVPGIVFVWTSGTPAVALVGAGGLATAQAHGQTTIAAAANGVSGQALLTVDLGATIASVTVTPPTATLLAVGATQAFTAVALDAGGTPVPVAGFTWTSSAPGIATVTPTSGVATAVSHGAATIRASVARVSGEASLTVDLAPAVASVTVTPPTATLGAIGATQTFTAVVHDAAGGALPGVPVVWTSTVPSVAAVDQTGLATAAGHGTTTIAATAGGRQGTATLTVNLTATVASIVVTPPSATLTAVGLTRQFEAVALDAGGAVVPGIVFAWTSATPAVALVGAGGLATAQAHGQTTIAATANGVSGQALLTVDLGATIASVTVTPSSATLLTVGATQTFTAVAHDAGGTAVPVVSFTWTSSAPAVATVTPSTGVATAVSHGATAIRASVAGVTGEASLAVDLAPAVASVTVTPTTATLGAVGATQAFTAVVSDAAGGALPGVPVVWSSSVETVATVDPLTGLATAVSHGATTIRATAGAASGDARIAVDLAETVASVTVTPTSVTLTALGATQAFTAVARDANGDAVPGIPVVWTSATTAVATIESLTGVATSTGHGTTVITASAAGRHGTAELRVDLAAAVASVAVSPSTATLVAVGATQQFTAVARDAGGAVLPGIAFTWTSSSAAAVVDAVTGLATAQAHGQATITATANGVSGAALLTVDLTETITRVEVTPEAATLTAVGATRRYTATARDAGGQPVPVSSFVWTSSVPAVGAVDPTTGLATAVGHGQTTIRATVAGISGEAGLTVELAATIATIAVTPPVATLHALGVTQAFTAVARDAAGQEVPGVPFTWTSAAPDVAAIDPSSGVATATGHGATTIVARANGVAGEARLTVDLSAVIASVVVTPEAATLTAVGAKRQFTAVARDAAGAVVPVSAFVWTSGTPAVAIVDATGLVTAVAHGSSTITASVSGVAGTAHVTVDLAGTVATITVTPSSVTLKSLGVTQAFTAVARDANGATVQGVVFAWSSSAPTVASIDPVSGVATSVGSGTTTITATAGSVSGTATLKVYQKVASIVVTPATVTLVGKEQSQQFTATAYDANGHVVPNVTFTWSSTSPSVATVNATGLAKACGYGTTKIKATVGSVYGYATLTVKRPY